jgi:tripartite-type tricarboxylate transporter receptor subunit TctC
MGLNIFRLVFVLASVVAGVGTAVAQSWPDRAIRWVVPYPPGGGTDVISRAMSQKLAASLGQQIIIDNRGGGGQVIGTEVVAKSRPDGYTILLISLAHSLNPTLVAKLPYDTLKDFAPVSLILDSSATVLAVNPSVPASSMKELIAWARANPGKVSYASSGNGSGGHMSMELLQSMAGTQMLHVPYKGASQALNDIVSGEVSMMFTLPLAAASLAKAGRVKILAISSRARSPQLPDIPTVAESGVPGYEASLWYGIVAPRGTPRPIIDRLNTAVREAVSSQEVRETYANSGGEAVSTTPEELERHIVREMEKWRKVIISANIKIQ